MQCHLGTYDEGSGERAGAAVGRPPPHCREKAFARPLTFRGSTALQRCDRRVGVRALWQSDARLVPAGGAWRDRALPSSSSSFLRRARWSRCVSVRVERPGSAPR